MSYSASEPQKDLLLDGVFSQLWQQESTADIVLVFKGLDGACSDLDDPACSCGAALGNMQLSCTSHEAHGAQVVLPAHTAVLGSFSNYFQALVMRWRSSSACQDPDSPYAADDSGAPSLACTAHGSTSACCDTSSMHSSSSSCWESGSDSCQSASCASSMYSHSQHSCSTGMTATSGTSSRAVIVEHIMPHQLPAAEALIRCMYLGTLSPEQEQDMGLLLEALVLADRYEALDCMDLITQALRCVHATSVKLSDLEHLLQLPTNLQGYSAITHVSTLLAQHILHLFTTCAYESRDSQEALLPAFWSLFGDVPVIIATDILLSAFVQLPLCWVRLWAGSDDLAVDSENSVMLLLAEWAKATERRQITLGCRSLAQLSGLVRLQHLSTSYLHCVVPLLDYLPMDKQHLPAVLMARYSRAAGPEAGPGFGAEGSAAGGCMAVGQHGARAGSSMAAHARENGIPCAWLHGPPRQLSLSHCLPLSSHAEVSAELLQAALDQALMCDHARLNVACDMYWAGMCYGLVLEVVANCQPDHGSEWEVTHSPPPTSCRLQFYLTGRASLPDKCPINGGSPSLLGVVSGHVSCQEAGYYGDEYTKMWPLASVPVVGDGGGGNPVAFVMVSAARTVQDLQPLMVGDRLKLRYTLLAAD